METRVISAINTSNPMYNIFEPYTFVFYAKQMVKMEVASLLFDIRKYFTERIN